jgi:hypothetical protein
MKTDLSGLYGKRVTPNVKLTFVITILFFGIYAACSSEADNEYTKTDTTANRGVVEARA